MKPNLSSLPLLGCLPSLCNPAELLGAPSLSQGWLRKSAESYFAAGISGSRNHLSGQALYERIRRDVPVSYTLFLKRLNFNLKPGHALKIGGALGFRLYDQPSLFTQGGVGVCLFYQHQFLECLFNPMIQYPVPNSLDFSFRFPKLPLLLSHLHGVIHPQAFYLKKPGEQEKGKLQIHPFSVAPVASLWKKGFFRGIINLSREALFFQAMPSIEITVGIKIAKENSPSLLLGLLPHRFLSPSDHETCQNAQEAGPVPPVPPIAGPVPPVPPIEEGSNEPTKLIPPEVNAEGKAVFDGQRDGDAPQQGPGLAMGDDTIQTSIDEAHAGNHTSTPGSKLTSEHALAINRSLSNGEEGIVETVTTSVELQTPQEGVSSTSTASSTGPSLLLTPPPLSDKSEEPEKGAKPASGVPVTATTTDMSDGSTLCPNDKDNGCLTNNLSGSTTGSENQGELLSKPTVGVLRRIWQWGSSLLGVPKKRLLKDGRNFIQFLKKTIPNLPPRGKRITEIPCKPNQPKLPRSTARFRALGSKAPAEVAAN